MFVGILIALTLGIMGLIIKYGKQYWLIAGYNTMPQEKKKNVDVSVLGNFMGNWLLGLAVVLLAGSYLGSRGYANAFPLSMLLFVAGIFYMVIKAQKFDKNVKSTRDKKILIGALAFSALIVLGVASMLVYGSLSSAVEVSHSGITVRGMYSTVIATENIVDISLEDEIPPILRRNNGLGLGNVQKGHFTLEGLGRGRLYLESGEGPFIFIITRDSYVIINYKDPARTEATYRDIKEVLS